MCRRVVQQLYHEGTATKVPTHRHRSHGLLALLCALAVVSGACGEFVTLTPTSDLALRAPAQTSVMVASEGTVLAELHAEENRQPVSLGDVPQFVRNAVIAVEDERFYSHVGVDTKAVARAILHNAREGGAEQGGSTITQQLAKNTVTGNDKTLERKLEEASVALQLEHTYTKDEILEQYLNTVYFGNGAYGIQAAAERYFDRPVNDLNLTQAAMLAALLRSPATYDPFDRPEAARGRRNLVLQKMRERGLITSGEAEAAQSQALRLADNTTQPWQAPYFVSHTLELLQHDPLFAVLGEDPAARADAIFRGGLRIETTLDPAAQAAAEEAIATTLDRPDDPRAAAVTIDPTDGGIRALVGGRDWNDLDDSIGRFNLATKAHRQPGSTFKEIVLAAALAQGWTLDRMIEAPAEVHIPPARGEPTAWTVANYADIDYGEVTLREATVKSINTVYARLVEALGAAAVVDMAEVLGVQSPLQPLRSIALGAQEVTVLDMATVQATLAAGGIYREPSVVTKISGADGTVLYERGAQAGERVLDEEVAWQVTTALQDVVDHGTGVRADLRRPTAGKTGTTQDTADAWFTGYTPDFAAAVWVGFHEGRVSMEPPLTRIRVEGGTWPAEIFARMGLRTLENTPATPFPIPDAALTTVSVDLRRDCLPTAFTPVDQVGERAYLSGTEPTAECKDDSEATAVADVPDVSGKTWDEARSILEAAGLRALPQPTFTTTVPPGFAIAQDPSAGRQRRLTEGYIVRVRVSSADRTQVKVPTVIGLGVTEAIAALDRAGFPTDIDRECPDDAEACTGPRDIVYEQTPGAGMATIHAVIDIKVYPGP